MSNLSAADKNYLGKQEQAQISALKQQWAAANAAGDSAGMAAAHSAAEAIRNNAGYSGGSDGSGYIPNAGSSASGGNYGGGRSAQEVQQWVDDYRYTNLSDSQGWTNGYSTAMNLRSMANYIRQQMQANSNAWASADEAGKAYLHDQNMQLAQILSDAAGGVKSTYNESLGRWETDNANLGYGYNTGAYNDVAWAKDVCGMTDEQIESYRNDTARYRNFVDQGIIRNWYDESSGYTGQYAHFANGPYGQLLMGTYGVAPETYMDLVGDGFGDGEGEAMYVAPRDAQGNIVPKAPQLKDTNTMTDYTRSKAAFVDENGVIQPGSLTISHPGRSTRGASNGSYAGKVSSRPASIGGTPSYRDPASISGFSAAQNAGSGGSTVKKSRYKGSGTGGSEGSSESDILSQWKGNAEDRANATYDHTVDKAVQQLLLTQAQAEEAYQAQRDQIAREELQALDNAALYAETRGDRGGIGQSQYDHIQAQADANRQSVSDAQVKLASDTARQIAQLRADGEFEKADEMMEISQTYLLKLLEMEQWAAEYQLSVDKFQESIRQWEQEYLLSLARIMI